MRYHKGTPRRADRIAHVCLSTLAFREFPMHDATSPHLTPPPPPAAAPAERRPRLWPGVLIVLLYWAALKVPGWFVPGTMAQFMISGFGSMGLALLFLLWWLFFSRVSWADRLLGLVAFAGVGAAAWSQFHPTLQGNRPDAAIFGLVFNVLPIVYTGWVLWLAVARSLSRPVRFVGLVVVLMLTWGAFTALRFDGVTGTFSPEFSFRWQPTAEERLLAARAAKGATATPATAPAAAAPELTPADWPGFRGPARDGRRPGVHIATDWARTPPKELWRHPVGPAWSSFAVAGPRVYTQEQLGNEERVVCYDAATGAEVWAHADETRHADNESGAGPRATPTVSEGRVYALGATGRLNCLDAATGKKIWTRDVAAESKAAVPIWGFSASPLIVQGIVTVFAGGPDGKGVLAYRAATGEPVWSAGGTTNSYCSMHPARLDGVEQLLVTSGEGLSAFDPADGRVLWQYEWDLGKDFARVVQPAVISDTDVLIGSGFGNGTRRVRVTRHGSGWKTEQIWETKAISPYFNDLVIHKGHLYGFHNNLLTCVNLETGKQTWKERGYGNGQVLLLPDQDLLLVLSEKGEVALVEAKPERRTELGRFPAITGKTWNHPVVAHGKLFVRNGEEAACYQLAEDGRMAAGR
jgi:outer membrane protein assembly factor BamB